MNRKLSSVYEIFCYILKYLSGRTAVLYFETNIFYNGILVTFTILMLYSPISIQSNFTFAQSASESTGYNHGCSDGKISDPNQRFLNQPGNGPENQNEQFRNDYIKGFNDCYGGYDSCYDTGVLAGMTVNENMRTGHFEDQAQRYGGCYDEGFHFGCALVKGTTEVCFDYLYAPPSNIGSVDRNDDTPVQ